ncbi:MAG: hypothetical protein CFE24_01390 [Flavobacterium sp. BFFFF2]|nr:MAG: hypothetical protein CFE24_01390 [Flavobacterium sp. BFFFF2]
MKKLLLLLIGMGLGAPVSAQCLTDVNGQYPTTTYSPNSCDGTTVNLVTDLGFASEYAVVNVTQGMLYNFSSSISTDLITISADGGNNVDAFGVGSVNWVATVTGEVRFYIHLNDGNCGSSFTFRSYNMVCGQAPSCLPVNAISLGAVTTNTAIVNWVDLVAPAGGYDIYLSNNATPPTANATPTYTVPAGMTDFQLTNLTPATFYTCWLRSSCSTSDHSTWTSITFSTECIATTNFSEAFDNSLNFPICWNRVGSGGNAAVQAPTTISSGPNALYLYSSSATSLGVVSMPPVSNAGAGTHRLRFNARAKLTVGGVIEVGYLTDPADDTSFVSLQNFTTTSITTYDTFVAILGTDPGTNEHLAFRNLGTPAYSVLIDDVFWEPIPTCEEPTALTTGSSTSNTISISWTAPSSTPAVGYEYYISTTSTTPSSSVTPFGTVGASATSELISNLSSATVYSIWIRSVCSGSDHSVWSNRASATTLCLPASTFTQSFDASTNMPTCWVKLGTGGSANVQATNGTVSAPNNLYMYSSSSSSMAVVRMPEVTNAGASTNRLHFRTRANFTVGGVIEVGYLTDPNDEATFVAVDQATTTSVTNYDNWFVYPAAAPGTNAFLAFRHTGNPPNSVLIDDVSWEAIPTCLETNNLMATNITQNSITISWTGPTDTPPIGYQYFISTSPTFPAPPIVPTGSVSNNYTDTVINGLNPATTYYVWIRSACANSDVSPWSLPIMVKTPCTASATPYTQDFETANVPDLPACTSIQNVGTGNNWTVASNPGFGFTSKTLQYVYNSTNDANVWFFTNPIHLNQGEAYTISYRYGSSSTTFTEKMRVAVGTSALSASMTTVLNDYSAINTGDATNGTDTFTPISTGNYVFGFNAYSDLNEDGLFVDDITVYSTLSATQFQGSNVSIYPNPTKDRLTFSLPNGITQIKLMNVLGQQVAVDQHAAVDITFDVSNLPSGTYMAQVTDSNGLISTVKWIKE